VTQFSDIEEPLREVTERFYEFETEHSLFQVRIDGVAVWELIRFDVHRQILRELDLIGKAHSDESPSNLEALRRIGRNLVTKNPFGPKDVDVALFGHERRKEDAEGLWWDIYCDPITASAEWDHVHLEQPYLGSHRSPAKSERLRYVDLLKYTGGALTKVTPERVTSSSTETRSFERAEQAIERSFDISVDVTGLATSALHSRAIRLPLWRSLLRRLDPDLCFVVVSYWRTTFVEACRKEGIPVAELQHGVIYPEHVGYSYPDGVGEAVPDYLLTFGPFWNDAASYPIPEENVRSVGFPYLERQLPDDPSGTSDDAVVFLSQGTVGRDLSKVAVTLAESLGDREMVFKLHPGETDRWRSVHPWLVDSPVRVVDGEDIRLYDLFERAGVQVGVNSTALYEGLAFGLETYVLPFSGVAAMRRLVEAGGATLVADADELSSELRSTTHAHGLPEEVFESDAAENIERFVNEVIG
jgi:hypothetical protein